MNIKKLFSAILDSEAELNISDATLVCLIKHFANEFIIDLCVINGTHSSIDLKDISATLEKDTIVINISEYIKKYIRKRIKRNEIIVKFKLD